jgi:thymidylate synthase
LARTPRPLPLLNFKRIPSRLEEFEYENLELVGYDPYPTIKAPIAV